MTVFTITEADEAKIKELRALSEASENVISFADMMKRVEQANRGIPTGFKDRNITLEWGWDVTYTVEEHRPGVPCRHLSMSSPKAGKTPIPMAMDMITQKFGFVNRLVDGQGAPTQHPAVYFEPLSHGGHAVNVIEPLTGDFTALAVSTRAVASQHESMQ